MLVEDHGGVAAVLVLRRAAVLALGKRRVPRHDLHEVRVLIVRRRRGKDRWRARTREKQATCPVHSPREQRERLHVGMTSRELRGVIHATASPRGTHALDVNSLLPLEKGERTVDVDRPLRVLLLHKIGIAQPFMRRSAALPIAAIVDRQRCHTGSGKLLAKRVPHFALLVALMQQQHGWTRRRRAEQRSLEDEPIAGANFHRARRGCRLGRAVRGAERDRQGGATDESRGQHGRERRLSRAREYKFVCTAATHALRATHVLACRADAVRSLHFLTNE